MAEDTHSLDGKKSLCQTVVYEDYTNPLPHQTAPDEGISSVEVPYEDVSQDPTTGDNLEPTYENVPGHQKTAKFSGAAVQTERKTETLKRISRDSGFSSQNSSFVISQQTPTNKSKQENQDRETFTVNKAGGLYNLHLMNITMMFIEANVRDPTEINVTKSKRNQMPSFQPGYQPLSDIFDIRPHDIVLQGLVTVKIPFTEGGKGSQNYIVMSLVSGSSTWKEFPADDDSEESYIILGKNCFLSIEKFGKFAVFSKCQADDMLVDFENCNNNNGNDSEEDDYEEPVIQGWYAVLNVLKMTESQVKATIKVTKSVTEEDIYKTLLKGYTNNWGVVSSLEINKHIMRLGGETSSAEKLLTSQVINRGGYVEYVLEAKQADIWEVFTVQLKEAERRTSCCLFTSFLPSETPIGTIRFGKDLYEKLQVTAGVVKHEHRPGQSEKQPRYVPGPEIKLPPQTSGAYTDIAPTGKGSPREMYSKEHNQKASGEVNDAYEPFPENLAVKNTSESEENLNSESRYPNSNDEHHTRRYIPNITEEEKRRRILSVFPHVSPHVEQLAQECCKLHICSDIFRTYIKSKFTLLTKLYSAGILQQVIASRNQKGKLTIESLYSWLLMDPEFIIHLDVYKAMTIYTSEKSDESCEAEMFLLEIHKEKLRQLLPLFVERMTDAKHIMGDLYQKGLVKPEEKQTLETFSTAKERAEHFLTEIILKKDQHVFKLFVKTLREWQNRDLANLISLHADMSS